MFAEDCSIFIRLFQGNPNCYGVHIPDYEHSKVEGKKVGKNKTVTAELTNTHYVKHLTGELSLGIVPIDHSGTINFAVIDVDDYGIDRPKLFGLIKKHEFPLVPFLSKSDGVHLFIFFKQKVKAKSVRPLIKKMLLALGLSDKTEIFPKQDVLKEDSQGSWINLPYYKHSVSKRAGLDLEGNKLTLAQAMVYALTQCTTIVKLTELIDNLPFSDAPPCLQVILMLEELSEGTRNIFLFNTASYLKAKFKESFADKLIIVNKGLSNPIDEDEIKKTIISSHNKKEYSYQCNDPILSSYCNKRLCAERQFGKGGMTVSDFDFGQLIQVNSDPPYYKWAIDSKVMEFYDEKTLLSQNRFRALSVRLLHKLPNILKATIWDDIIKRALSNIIIEYPSDDEEEVSEGGYWKSKVLEFFSRGKAQVPEQINEGLVWIGPNKAGVLYLYFKANELLKFFNASKDFARQTKAEHRSRLIDLGCDPKAHLRTMRSWRIKVDVLKKDPVFEHFEVKEIDESASSDYIKFVEKEKY